MSKDIQSALERARAVAAKITGQISSDSSHIGHKRSADSGDEHSAKKFASVNDAVGAQLAMLKAQQLGGSTVSEDFKVPDRYVGLVIGKGGEQLHRLQSETACKVQIAPDSNGQPDRVFTLLGTKDSIEKCKKAIDDIIKRGANDPAGNMSQLLKANIEVLEILVPANKCGLVIGKGGETIKRLSEQYGVKLVVIQDASTTSGTDKPLRITGDPEKVARAKEAVLALINPQVHKGPSTNEYGSKNILPGQTEVYIKVPSEKAGIVIGKGGESVKEINRRSGAHVEIDKKTNTTDGGDKMFIIRGSNEQIQYAQQLIYEKITGVVGSVPPSGFFNSDQSSATMGYGASAGGYDQAWSQYYSADASKDPNAAAWAAYYQQYYGQAAGATPAAQPTSATTAQPSINPQTGQPDYSQAWVEYYRSLGMYEQAEAILRQTQTSSSTSATPNGSTTSSTPSTGSSSTNTTQAQGATTNGSSSTPSSSENANGNYAQWANYYQNYPGYYKQENGQPN